VEDIVRIPITLRLQQFGIGTQPPISVSEIAAVIASWCIQVLSRGVSILDGPTNHLLFDVAKDFGTSHVGVWRVGAGQLDLELSYVGQR
jgi:hypothetical protein